jgi:nicotinamidase-related amidase
MRFGEESREFIQFLEKWMGGLKPLILKQEIKSPHEGALISVDMINGFCHQGPLASPRVREIIPAVTALFKEAHGFGVRNFVLIQDTHSQDTPEFEAFPPHATQGSRESETIPELQELPFSHLFTVIPKNSLHPAIGTSFDDWLGGHQDLRTFIVVGNCTDLCVYNLALYLRLRANALGLKGHQILLPGNCVQTYHLSLRDAHGIGALPHDGDFLHALFLYHMALNGVRVLSSISA